MLVCFFRLCCFRCVYRLWELCSFLAVVVDRGQGSKQSGFLQFSACHLSYAKIVKDVSALKFLWALCCVFLRKRLRLWRSVGIKNFLTMQPAVLCCMMRKCGCRQIVCPATYSPNISLSFFCRSVPLRSAPTMTPSGFTSTLLGMPMMP